MISFPNRNATRQSQRAHSLPLNLRRDTTHSSRRGFALVRERLQDQAARHRAVQRLDQLVPLERLGTHGAAREKPTPPRHETKSKTNQQPVFRCSQKAKASAKKGVSEPASTGDRSSSRKPSLQLGDPTVKLEVRLNSAKLVVRDDEMSIPI